MNCSTLPANKVLPNMRAAGILLHITSLPGPRGSGDFGRTAYQFVDWLVSARQGLWQVLPLVPPGFGESPYQGFSAFAGNPLLISLESLEDEPWAAGCPVLTPCTRTGDWVDFVHVRKERLQRLRLLHDCFEERASDLEREKIRAFHEANAWWLNDYSLFMAIKESQDGLSWSLWPDPLARRDPSALLEASDRLKREIQFRVFVQYQFFRQWDALKRYANERGVRIIGDLPIFVAHDSADVWANQGEYHLNQQGKPTVVAGVPPDYFCSTGQRWGNPLYRWDVMREDQYSWWISRIARSGSLFDYIRLDHFRGFEAYWKIPADSLDAVKGEWVPGPGAEFFETVQSRLGPLRIIAEDLGVITPQVQALRDRFEFPGMRVLQFAFGDDPLKSLHLPHNYVRNAVAYTGTHDNDTIVGWMNSRAGEATTRTEEQIQRERQAALQYLGGDGGRIHWRMIRLAMSSVARFSITTMQDVLGLGSEARMNLPGSCQGNWRWRLREEQLTSGAAQILREMAESYDRLLFDSSGKKNGD